MLPKPSAWSEYVATSSKDDTAGDAIRQLQTLEATGSVVHYVAADIADAASVKRLADFVAIAFDSLQGIFHAAEYADRGDLLQDIGSEDLTSKSVGAAHLRNTFDFSRLNFVILNSSMSAAPAQFEHAVTSAAAFHNALANDASQRGHQGVTSVSWVFDGNAAAEGSAKYDNSTAGSSELPDLTFGRFLAENASTLFDYLLSRGLPEVIISPVGNYSTVSADHTKLNWTPEMGQVMGSGGQTQRDNRRNVSTPYQQPQTVVEKAVVTIWENLLGIAPVGINDDFFDLGGHSLMATQVLSKVLKEFGVTLQLRELFEATTVAKLAAQIEAIRAQEQYLQTKPAFDEESLRKSIDAMSPEEIAALLAEKKRQKDFQSPVA